jgi:hypothetical protein
VTGMRTAVVAPELGRRRAGALAVGALAGCAVVALADPAEAGIYPTCPTHALLGVDCPACGTLRGLHAALRGDVLGALDHNLLLLVALPFGLLLWGRWVLEATGSPSRGPQPLRWPAWVVPVVVTVLVAFAILRNLPISSLVWLDSA